MHKIWFADSLYAQQLNYIDFAIFLTNSKEGTLMFSIIFRNQLNMGLAPTYYTSSVSVSTSTYFYI